MSIRHQRALIGTLFTALLVITTAIIPVPQVLRIAFGISIVFLLPGFAVTCAVIPPGKLSHGEQLLSSLGISLAMTTCTAVLLGATPIGLSRGSLAVALGGITVLLSAYAWFRIYFADDMRLKANSNPDRIRE
jgi:uncharacterized membrane protein